MEANNTKAMRDVVAGIKNTAHSALTALSLGNDTSRFLWDIISKCEAVLTAPVSNQGVLESPKDVNEKYIHIGDMVHMLNTSYDGDHEWDGIVTSLEYVGNGGGDDWLVHGEDGAAWACECEVVNRKGDQL